MIWEKTSYLLVQNTCNTFPSVRERAYVIHRKNFIDKKIVNE